MLQLRLTADDEKSIHELTPNFAWIKALIYTHIIFSLDWISPGGAIILTNE